MSGAFVTMEVDVVGSGAIGSDMEGLRWGREIGVGIGREVGVEIVVAACFVRVDVVSRESDTGRGTSSGTEGCAGCAGSAVGTKGGGAELVTF